MLYWIPLDFEQMDATSSERIKINLDIPCLY